MAEQDSLTELVNRIGFERALTEHVVYAARYGSGGSVIALGIDNFKYVNESLGVEAGDELLVELAELIGGRLRKTDVLARVGGDVFGILVHGADLAKALSVDGRAARDRPGHRLRPQRRGDSDHAERRGDLPRRPLHDRSRAARRGRGGDARGEGGRPRPRRRLRPRLAAGRGDERRAWSERVRQATEGASSSWPASRSSNLETGETTQHESCCACGMRAAAWSSRAPSSRPRSASG